MQLVAYGAQDVYLSGNPQITFFKVVYRRHTNFSVEPIQQTWTGIGDFGHTVTCNINRNGDLITNMYVVVKLNPQDANYVDWGYVNKFGHALIENVKIEIGGSKIDEHYSEWLNIWYELTHKSGQARGYARMIGDIPDLNIVHSDSRISYQLYIPLQFWFNRNNGLALPLIALQYHDVRVTLKYRDQNSCINYLGPKQPIFSKSLIADSYLLIDYIYLDSDERKRFAQASHEYLIEQLQFTGSETITANQNQKYQLNFNHPSKYLIWVSHLEKYNNNKYHWLSYIPNYSYYNSNITELLSLPNINSHIDLEVGNKKYLQFIKIIGLVCSKNFKIDGANYIVSLHRNANNNNNGYALDYNASLTETNLGPLATLLSKVNIGIYIPTNISQVTLDTTPNSPANYTASFQVNLSLNAFYEIIDKIMYNDNGVSLSDASNPWEYIKKMSDFSKFVTNVSAADSFIHSIGLHMTDIFNYSNYINFTNNPCVSAKLQLNGHDRFQERDGTYFNYVQPAQHFSNIPPDGINVYSFALKPEDYQPSGTCNFSRVDNATLIVTFGVDNEIQSSFNSPGALNIYTQNYNILRIMSGMGGLAYSS